MAGKRINPFFSFNYFNQNSGGGGGGAVTSVNGAIGDVIVDLDSVLAQTTTQPDGNYGLNIVSGVPTLVPIQGETVGSYKAFSTTTLPSNYLWCNGATVLIATYPDLFAVIGNTYGGDGVTTFAVPNMLDKLPKGDNGTNIGTIGGDNTLTESQLPIVKASGTISVSQNDGNANPLNGDFFANPVDFGGSSDINGFILNGSQIPTVEIQGVNVSFGSGQPHEHPYLAVRWAICFESVGVSGASPTPSFNAVLGVSNDSPIRALFNGIPYVAANEIPVFLDETSTIADFVTGATHYYIGNANITYDYDLLPYPLPVPVSGFNFVNLSVFNVTFVSYFGNYTYILAPTQSLQDIQIVDNGSAWEIQPTAYFDNIYNLQQVTDKGAVTTNAIIVRNNPDIYRTRYSILGQEVQRDDLGFRVSYYENGMTKSTTANSKSWQLQFPDLTANANNSSYVVDFRPNVSGTVAYLGDINNTPIDLADEQILTTSTPLGLSANTKRVFVNPATTLATASIQLQSTPYNGQEVVIVGGGAINTGVVVTELTVFAAASILSGDPINPTTLVLPFNAAKVLTLEYSQSLNQWFLR